MRVVHIAETEIGLTGGMARVAWYWKLAFEKRGHQFRHIGKKEVGNISHIRHFPEAALRYYLKEPEPADVVLVHEPSSGMFASKGIKNVVVSHGLERRGWQMQNRKHPDLVRASLKSRLFYPLWRLRGCDIGLSKADGVLLLNQDDKSFAMAHYGLENEKIHIFENGVNLPQTLTSLKHENARNVLFVGTWIARKGIRTLARTAKMLYDRGMKVKWVLAGTGLPVDRVLKTWPVCLHTTTEVIPRFSGQEESDLFQRCNLFVLPSFFEGQPLALLQAMAHGRCCITTNICGQKDTIQNRVNGLLFEPGDASALAGLILESSGSLSLQAIFGKGAHDTVKAKDWNNVSDKVVDFIEQVYARRL